MAEPAPDIIAQYFEAEKRLAHRARQREFQLQQLWGASEPYTEQAEDRSSLVLGTFFYSWATAYLSAASREELRADALPGPLADCRAHELGRRLSRQLRMQWLRQQGWSPYMGMPVRLQEGRGVLRYVGPVQQMRAPGQLFAAIAWSRVPRAVQERHRRETEAGLPGALITDGAVEGETLYRVTPADGGEVASVERVEDVRLTTDVEAEAVDAELEGRLPPTAKETPRDVSVLRAVFYTLWWEMLILAPLNTFLACFALVPPLVLQRYIAFLEEHQADTPEDAHSTLVAGAWLVAAFFIVQVVDACTTNKYSHLSYRCSRTVKSAVTSLLFEKCLTISSKSLARPEMSAGRLVNMMSADVDQIGSVASSFWFLLLAPIQIFGAVYLMYRLLGWSALTGVVALLLFIPIQGVLMGSMFSVWHAKAEATDVRMKATNEFLSGIRIAKFMSWEPSFMAKIEKARETEISLTKKIQMTIIYFFFFNNAAPCIAIATMFFFYTHSGHTLTSSVAFPAITLLSVMQMPFAMLPGSFQVLSQVLVASRRINLFLACEDATALEGFARETESRHNSASKRRQDEQQRDFAVIFRNATLTAFSPEKLPVPMRLRPRVAAAPEPETAIVDERDEREGEGEEGEEQAHSHHHGHGHGHGSANDDKDSENDKFFVLRPKELLAHLDLKIPLGKLTVIVGSTGSGKSTLLDALVGSIAVTEGEVLNNYADSIAYVPQQPWVMNATVRENVEFYAAHEGASEAERERRLKRAIDISQLAGDLSLLTDGLNTEIGERGVTLSGGQKARVSLARAVYADKDIYLLDDPLSALDAHVSERVMKDCILGALRGKTRVLATHQLHVLPHADCVVVLSKEKHGVAYQGDYQGYVRYCESEEGRHWMKGEEKGTEETSTTERDGSNEGANPSAVEPVADDLLDAFSPTAGGEAAAESGKAFPSASPPASATPAAAAVGNSNSSGGGSSEGEEGGEDSTAGRLMSIEETFHGSVPLREYAAYLQACGGVKAGVLVLVAFAVTAVMEISPSLWLSLWGTDALALTPYQYLGVYVGLTAVETVCSPIRYYICTKLGRRASRRIHSKLLSAVSSGQLSFFDTTPLGRLVNRFSRDIKTVDSLPYEFLFSMGSVFSFLTSMAVMTMTQYFVIVLLVPLSYVYYRLLCFYATTNREIQRITNIINSPVFTVLEETLVGRWTIEAYRKSSVVLREAGRRLDTRFSCELLQRVAELWLAVRVQSTSALITSGIAVCGVLSLVVPWVPSSGVGLLALSLTMALQLSNTLDAGMYQLASLEASMNSMERVDFYEKNVPREDGLRESLEEELRLLQERQAGADTVAVTIGAPPSLPLASPALEEQQRGALLMAGVTMRYRPRLPLVLRGVNFSVRPGEKVGIVGRTGSGKSSILLAFLRLVEIEDGEFSVCGRAAQGYSLRELRGLFSMIPQDPLLFEGTVRSNLDPFCGHDDAAVWAALRHVGLEERAREDERGLDAAVQEGGRNFSVGQRQLLCLARALLKRGSAFLLMDEATANVDPQLDAQIQRTVKECFARHTVITVAHRLRTVAQYDKVAVMSHGVVVEMDSPAALLRDSRSAFSGLVSAMGGEARRRFEELLRSK